MLVLKAGIRVNTRVKARVKGKKSGLSFASWNNLSSSIRIGDSCRGVGVAFRFRDYSLKLFKNGFSLKLVTF